MNLRLLKIQKLVKILFKDDNGNPLILTESQLRIVEAILYKENPRVQIIAPTQYGKSNTIAIALILASTFDHQGYAIVAPSQQKADIIMRKVIQHSFDNPIFISELDFKGESIERLKREKSQKRITWKGGGEIEAITADARNTTRTKESLMGLGKQNVIEDESALIPDDLHSTVVRMLGGFPGNNFLLKVGNPFNRNHFLRSWESDKYKKIFIDYHIALDEKRFTGSFIEEMKDQMFFDILYECKFPNEDDVLPGGYRKLIKNDLLQKAFISEAEFAEKYCTKEITNKKGEVIKVPEGETMLGCDFAGMGSDRNSYVARWSRVMKLLTTNLDKDTMTQIPIVEDFISSYNINDINIFLDYGGLGQGIGDRLAEKDIMASCIMFGQKAPEPDKYKNIRAYMYYNLMKWIENGGKIVKDDRWNELLAVNYKTDSERKFQIQPKEELKKYLKEMGMAVTSPDCADSAALTFAEPSILGDNDVAIM